MFNWQTLISQSFHQKYALATESTDRQNIINMHIKTEGVKDETSLAYFL